MHIYNVFNDDTCSKLYDIESLVYSFSLQNSKGKYDFVFGWLGLI